MPKNAQRLDVKEHEHSEEKRQRFDKRGSNAKLAIAIKMKPWVLAALNVIQNASRYPVYRTNIIEAMLIEGISKHDLNKDSPEVQAELNRLKHGGQKDDRT